MKKYEAFKIIRESGMRLLRIDEGGAESRQYDSAYAIQPLSRGHEEAPEGFQSIEKVYWDEFNRYGKAKDLYYNVYDEDLPHTWGPDQTNDVYAVVKKLWYRVAEYMIEHDNEPCSAAQIKRDIGLEGYASTFATMRKDGFLTGISPTKVTLSDWAVEKYYEAKKHAESDKRRLEAELVRKYGTLEDQMKAHNEHIKQIRDEFDNYIRILRKKGTQDYFDKRRNRETSINK